MSGSVSESEELPLEPHEKPAHHQEEQVQTQQSPGEPQNHENRENVLEVENTKLKKDNQFLKNR